MHTFISDFLNNGYAGNSRLSTTTSNLRKGIAWVETPALSMAAFILAWLVNPEDPLTLNSGFPWVILAPVMVGLRYGFAWAAISSTLLLLLSWLHAYGVESQWHMPGSWFLGTLAVSVIAGEFRDQWEQKLGKMQQSSLYRKTRIKEFTRSYQLLKRSHALLEQDLALSGYSLYNAVADIGQQFCNANDQTPLNTFANDLIRLLSHFGDIQAAALLKVENGRANTTLPLASTGQIPELEAQDPLITRVLSTGKASCIKPELLNSEDTSQTQLLACAPLIDSHGHFHALLAIRHMSFLCLNENHITQIAVLCGHIADQLHMNKLISEIPHHDPKIRVFHAHLQRCWKDAAEYDIHAGLVAIQIGNFGVAQALIDSIVIHKQPMEQVLSFQTRSNAHWMVLLLMPLCEQIDVDTYIENFPAFLNKHHNVAMTKAEVHISCFILNSEIQNPVEILQFLNSNDYPLASPFSENQPPKMTQQKNSIKAKEKH